MGETCTYCGQRLTGVANRVSIYGMYSCHLFHRLEGATVDDVVAAWEEHNATPNPAEVGGRMVGDLGPSMLCPAIVMTEDGKELRRVGKPVSARTGTESNRAVALAEYRAALLSDPDIPRILQDTRGEPTP